MEPVQMRERSDPEKGGCFMELKGNAIAHKVFGRGVITDVTDNVVTVCFQKEEKKFLYPDAFGEFLTLKDQTVQRQIEVLLSQRKQEAGSLRQAVQDQQERLLRLRCLKIPPKSQAAFGMVENNAEEVFGAWSIFSGRYLSGSAKGDPRIPSRLKPNSACLVTALDEGAPEKERRILGVFMLRDDFDGSDCKDGNIPSHEQYRMKLPENGVKLWDYFDENERPAHWGKAEIRYFSNRTMQRILEALLQVTAETDQRDQMQALYQYFCFINRITDVKEN